MVSVLASSAVDLGFEYWERPTKDNEICIYCFVNGHALLMSKRKDWLVRCQNNVSEWSEMPILGLLFQ